MYRVFMIDDDIHFTSMLKSVVSFYAREHEVFQIEAFHIITDNFQDFLPLFNPESPLINIYIIDIELNGSVNGLDLARKIRQADFNGYILFITSHIEMTAITYQYNLKALTFIFKGDPSLKSLIFSAFDQILLEQNAPRHDKVSCSLDAPGLDYVYKSHYFRLPFQEILYIETDTLKRRLVIHTDRHHYAYPHTLKHLSGQLPVYFKQAHRGILVNAHRVREIDFSKDRYIIHFEEGFSCPGSSRYVPILMEYLQVEGEGRRK